MTQQIVGVPTAVAAFIGRPSKPIGPSPARISSLADYEAVFGPGELGTPFDLWKAIGLFYENGGGDAWVAPVESNDLALYLAALDRIGEESVTLLVAPDALSLPRDDYYTLARTMIAQAARLGDRFAIVDVHGGGGPISWSHPGVLALVAEFRAAIPPLADTASYGAAYFPWLLLDPELKRAAPPAAAIAGLYALNDAERGVWMAPAKISPVGATDVTAPLTDDEQAGMDVSAVDGLSVNAIRHFTGQGVMVWGAHTLDGNSQDLRYVSVRRTLIYVAQSVKGGLATLATLPNDTRAWAQATAMVNDFLTGLWKQGALAGDTPEAAFTVNCGLGATMTREDQIMGMMNVTIQVAITHPAEFLFISLQQQMRPAGWSGQRRPRVTKL